MSMSDPLGDMLTRIRNGQNARKNVVSSPSSRFRTNVLEAVSYTHLTLPTILLV